MKVTIAPDFEHLLPALSDAESAQLEANCKADPLHERMPPVVIWSNQKNTIIDGHNQHRVREKLRLKVKYAKLEFDTRDDAKRYALDVQFGRRNCDATVRAMSYAAFPHKSLGGDMKSDRSANLRTDSVAELAEKARVSERTMTAAVKVTENAAAPVIKAVKAGEVKVSDAAAVADLPKSEQAAALKKVKSGEAKTLRGAAFDTAKLDKQPARKETKRPGKATVSTPQRKECLALHAKLCRALQAIGIYDEFISHLSQIAERLKSI